MASLSDVMKKALYLGVGIASYTGSKAANTVAELRGKVKDLAEDLIRQGEMTREEVRTLMEDLLKQGEMTTEEARRMVEDIIAQAQQTVEAELADRQAKADHKEEKREPRPIEIDTEDDEANSPAADALTAPTPAPSSPGSANSEAEVVAQLRQQVANLRQELEQLQKG